MLEQQQQKVNDKDRKIKVMEDLIKTNQKHIDHLKQIITQLKKQLQYEQKRNQDLDKENVHLKSQIKVLNIKPLLLNQSTQTYIERKEHRQHSIKDDLSPTTKLESPTLQSRKISKHGLKLDVHSALKRQQTVGPLTSVKKSTNYLQELSDEKLINSIKERIPARVEKTQRNISMIMSLGSQRQRSLLFNFSQSTVFDKTSQFDEEQTISQFQPRQVIETIDEELRQDLLDTSFNLQQSHKIYEKFYIMGCEKKEFAEFDNDASIKEGILPASILYKSHNGNVQNVEPYESIIHGFAYPFGNQVEKIKVNDSFRKLKEIMYSGNKYELLDKFHVFTIKNQEEQPQKDYSNHQLLMLANPERLLYGICLSVYDYIETTPDNIELTFKNRKKRTFWKYKKTYCFLTYFPFFELFQDLLIAIINLIKINRTSRYVTKNTQEYEVLKEVDGDKIIKEFQGQLNEFLESIINIKPEQCHQLLEFKTEAGILKYKIPNQLIIQTEIRLWSANIALQLINHRELITIFLCILHETSVIFVSDKLHILSSVIHFFHNLLRPISWTNPIIYSVPEQLLTMIESPVPIIIGVNLSEADFDVLGIRDRVDTSLFVFLDRTQESKIVPKPFALMNGLKMPYFGGLIAQVEHQTRSKSTVRNPSPGLMLAKQDDKKQIKLGFDESDLQKSRSVLELFNKMITQYIIKHFPDRNEEGLLQDKNDLNLQLAEDLMLNKSDSRDRDFIRELFKTQYFQYYMQEQYID